MNNMLEQDQISKIVEILAQYAPDGWTELKMHLVTDETHTEVTTYAVTSSNPTYGFRLDSEDREVLDGLVDAAWNSGGRSWSSLDFSVSANGEFAVDVK